MSLSGALASATSGLQAAQASLNTISDNIANVNTPGYVRKVVNQEQQVVAGQGQGVKIVGVQRVTDQYLQAASLSAGSQASQWDTYSTFMDNAQSLFGDPSSDGTGFFFNRPDQIYSDFTSAADDPSSSLLRNQAISDTQQFLGEADRINTQINQLSQNVDSQMKDAVDQANDLLSQIDKLNSDISRAKVTNTDGTGSENNQQSLITQLSTLMSIKVTENPQGGVTIRSPDGVMLAGQGASKLTYTQSGSMPGYVTATSPGSGATQPLTITSGQMRGLLDLRNTTLPGLSDQLGEFMNGMADQLNAAHNASTAFPPPTSLTGRDTGMDLPTAVSGFSGKSTVAIVNSSGVVQKQVAIDFTAGTMSTDGGVTTTNFTPANFLTQLNANLGSSGTASFTGGQLSISASGSNGVAIDEGTSMKAGKAFSSFFGLNDLIRSTGPGNYDTGLKTTDASGFTPGGQITLHLAQPDGNPIKDITVTMPAASTMADVLSALNNNSTGAGLYGQFSLDSQGALTFSPSAPANAMLSVASDTTQRGAGGPSLSNFFGLGPGARADRASNYVVDPTIAADPTKLALGQLDLTAAAGQPAISAGDGRGAAAIAASGNVTTQFGAAGTLGKVSMTVSGYAAEFGGSIGRAASTAATESSNAASVQTEADSRLQSVEGVNLDEELVRLTTYQQAYSASARMVQASKDLFDTLLGILN
jgi:flagellar hook-associated protein 1 FlgK